jgi:hypothetical protein
MRPQKLPNGNYLLAKRAEGPGVIADGLVEVPADDPELLRELAWWRAFDERSSRMNAGAK